MKQGRAVSRAQEDKNQAEAYRRTGISHDPDPAYNKWLEEQRRKQNQGGGSFRDNRDDDERHEFERPSNAVEKPAVGLFENGRTNWTWKAPGGSMSRSFSSRAAAWEDAKHAGYTSYYLDDED